VEVDLAAVRIGQREVRQPFADLGPGRRTLGETRAAGVAERCRRVESEGVALDRDG